MKLHEVSSVDDLISLLKEGIKLDYEFFWGHGQLDPTRIDVSCLSNWFPSEFIVEGIKYRTAEHFLMAQKAELFGDWETQSQILTVENPAEAKRLGRRVSGFKESTWIDHRFEIAITGIEAKFSQNREMGQFLQSTGTKVLVESSPYDTIWGIGLKRTDKNATNASSWRGLNLLGFALMEVRNRLAVTQKPSYK